MHWKFATQCRCRTARLSRCRSCRGWRICMRGRALTSRWVESIQYGGNSVHGHVASLVPARGACPGCHWVAASCLLPAACCICRVATRLQVHIKCAHGPLPDHVLCVQDLLRQTAVLKLNGGLGTSMGLEKAKSLLEVRAAGCASHRKPGVQRTVRVAVAAAIQAGTIRCMSPPAGQEWQDVPGPDCGAGQAHAAEVW